MTKHVSRLLLLPAMQSAMPLVVAAADVNTETTEFPVQPPAFQMLRFNEDYSSLTNPATHIGWSAPMKYIPFAGTNHPDIYLTFGGELRYRFEDTQDLNFGIGAGPESYLLQRITLLSDLHLTDRVRIFAMGISGYAFGSPQPPPPVQQDPLDLQFAFLDVLPYLTDDESLTVRFGRFGMSFGSGRLVATRAAPNIPFKFDGAEMIYKRPQWEITGFVTRPVQDSGGFGGDIDGTQFWGLYATHWFDDPHTIGLDFYYLGIHNESATYASGTGEETRHSFGSRQFGKWNHWDWNTEQVLQVGSFGNDSIRAWTVSLDSGYTWDAMFAPRLGLKADVTSGNRDLKDGTLETFNALYFMSGYFNDASLLRPQNIIDVHPNLGLALTPKLSVDGGVDAFWRYSRNDAVYAVPGFIAVPALSTAQNYVGTAADVNLTWQIARHFNFQASYVHFFSGSYIGEAGGRNVNYVSTTISFVF